MYYTEPRYTKNLDIVVGTLPNELGAIRSALAEFGFPMSDKAAAELAVPNRMIKIGHPPGRLDILNEIEGVDFDQAWERRVVISLDGVNAPFIALSDLVAAKRAAGRPQDLLDLAKLEKVGED